MINYIVHGIMEECLHDVDKGSGGEECLPEASGRNGGEPTRFQLACAEATCEVLAKNIE